MIARCSTCGELFDTTVLPKCGHVTRRKDTLTGVAHVWDAERFREPAPARKGQGDTAGVGD